MRFDFQSARVHGVERVHDGMHDIRHPCFVALPSHLCDETAQSEERPHRKKTEDREPAQNQLLAMFL